MFKIFTLRFVNCALNKDADDDDSHTAFVTKSYCIARDLITFDLVGLHKRAQEEPLHSNVMILSLHNSVRKFSDPIIQLPSAPIEAGRIINIRFNTGTDRVRLNFFSKNRINRVLELELEHTNKGCRMF